MGAHGSESWPKQEDRALMSLAGHRCIAERFVMTQAQIIASFAAKDFTLISMSPLNIRPKIGIALLPSSSPRVAFKNVNNGK